MNYTKQPVAFDIEIKENKGSPARSPPIAQKLMKTKSMTASIEEIESKLKRAEELRKEEFARKTSGLTDEKIKEVNERKNALEAE